MNEETESRFLLIGEVVKPHGIRGELKVRVHTEEPERFSWLDTVYVGEHALQPMEVEGARLHKGGVLLKLVGCDDREAAERLRGAWLQIPETEALPLAEDEYYLYQLEGLEVWSEAGERLGELVDVIETKANDVFVVHDEAGKELLLPDIPQVIRQIDFENGRITVHLLPGLRP